MTKGPTLTISYLNGHKLQYVIQSHRNSFMLEGIVHSLYHYVIDNNFLSD